MPLLIACCTSHARKYLRDAAKILPDATYNEDYRCVTFKKKGQVRILEGISADGYRGRTIHHAAFAQAESEVNPKELLEVCQILKHGIEKRRGVQMSKFTSEQMDSAIVRFLTMGHGHLADYIARRCPGLHIRELNMFEDRLNRLEEALRKGIKKFKELEEGE